ncbi:MAG: hypothetical protein IRZ16_05620 [Myxococcaceae bacterium]|nr:hypothetical protein [Myxococcaceae bacterium]
MHNAPRLVVAAGLVTATVAASGAEIAPIAQAEATLRTECLLTAADPKNPWALAHGIVALGPAFAAADGRRAQDVIVRDFVHRVDAQRTDGGVDRTVFTFDRYAPDHTPIEPHANLLIKSLVLAGLKDTQAWETPSGKVTLGDLVKGVELGFTHVPQNELYWEDVGWTLDLLAERHTPARSRFVNTRGETVDLIDVMNDALAYLELAQKDLAEGMDQHRPEVPKRKQGIYAHACGGLHLIQAINHWARFPQVRKAWGKRWERQIDVLFYRLGSEQRQYDAAWAQAQKMPQFKLPIAVQRVKFYGHFLETVGRLKKENGYRFDAKQKAAIDHARALLAQAVVDLEALDAYAKLPALKTSQPQLYLDLIGDSCHAAHGLALVR